MIEKQKIFFQKKSKFRVSCDRYQNSVLLPAELHFPLEQDLLAAQYFPEHIHAEPFSKQAENKCKKKQLF